MAERQGVPKEALLGPVGADPALLEDPDAQVPLEWTRYAWAEAPRLAGDAAASFAHPAEVILGERPGTHAVALFHNENGDGKLDTNFIGIPREDVGVSNNQFRANGPPNWDDAKFNVNGDLVLDVTIRY